MEIDLWGSSLVPVVTCSIKVRFMPALDTHGFTSYNGRVLLPSDVSIAFIDFHKSTEK